VIRINFDPHELHKVSLQFLLTDLQDAKSLAIKLRDSPNPLSQHLRAQLTGEVQQELATYDGSSAVSESVQDAIIAGLNELLNGPVIFERKRFAGVTLRRETLIKELIKLKEKLIDLEPKREGPVCLNRLLFEDAYPQELAKSQRAEWDGWVFLAQAATKKVIKEWEDWKSLRAKWKQKRVQSQEKEDSPKFEPTFEDYIWKGFRNWLLDNIFHNKCAYCETPHVGFPGDAEHFRPKGRVRIRSENDDLEIVTIVDENDEKIAHPGYFWLAYHWDNLLPACETCNRGGKNDLFPVRKPHVAVKRLTMDEIDDLIHKITESENEKNIFYLEPDDLDQMEDRLLLHPYHDDPRKHIYFKADGRVAERQGSEQGKASIRIYNLNDEKTVKARQREQANGFKYYKDEVVAAIPNMDKARDCAFGLQREYYNGERPYAAAVFDFIHFFLDKSLIDPEILLKEHSPKGQN
jgi:hypothetical protein